MVGIVGCVLSYALLASGLPGADVVPAYADLCAPGIPTCAMIPAGTNGLLGQTPEDQAPPYATPAEVDCRAGSAAAVAAATGTDPLSIYGGCERPNFDFRYRVSRFPESERQNGGFAPQRSRRLVVRRAETVAAPVMATCAGLPPTTDQGGLTFAAFPPVEIYARTVLPPPGCGVRIFEAAKRAVTRVVDPLDRPPRPSHSARA